MCVVGVKGDVDNNGDSDMMLKIFIHQRDMLLCYDCYNLKNRQFVKISKELNLGTAYQFHFDSLVSWHPGGISAEDSRLKTTRDYKRTIANDYIKLRNRKILRRSH
ncbi:hypothetical protein IFM89_006721 [Coptis chinensis]|uniref:Uncharacterized protein n=1 Tax=Coptis chinensis TaxID=261450 RepID=A0A835LIF2_9MAGN|nr:hypothetical protein IFM89_006721 [Coptis chinensis]